MAEKTRKAKPRKKAAPKKETTAEEPQVLDTVIEEAVAAVAEETPQTNAAEQPVFEEQVPTPVAEPVAEKKEEPVLKEKKEEMVVTEKKDDFYEVKNRVSEKDTKMMMEYLGIGKLPDVPAESFWTKAVAKILKRDSTVSWCVLTRRNIKDYKIEKAFGTCSPIVKVGTIIPVEVLPAYIIDRVAKMTDLEKRNYLMSLKYINMSEKEIMAMKSELLDITIINIEKRIKNEQEEARRPAF